MLNLAALAMSGAKARVVYLPGERIFRPDGAAVVEKQTEQKEKADGGKQE
jgi:hypothetical protein